MVQQFLISSWTCAGGPVNPSNLWADFHCDLAAQCQRSASYYWQRSADRKSVLIFLTTNSHTQLLVTAGQTNQTELQRLPLASKTCLTGSCVLFSPTKVAVYRRVTCLSAKLKDTWACPGSSPTKTHSSLRARRSRSSEVMPKSLTIGREARETF